MDIEQWPGVLDRLWAEWAPIAGPVYDVDEWTAQLVEMQAYVEERQRAGRWAAGPHDLMSIVGLNRWELAHSAALSWLCTPDAGHGLGARFLEALVRLTGDPVDLTRTVTTLREESRQVLAAGLASEDVLDGEPLPTQVGAETRADVVVQGSGWSLVIEVKVDAGEQPDQAQRLYDGWKDDGDVRFLFLTRNGRLPTTIAPGLQYQWTGLAWPDLRAILTRLADETVTNAAVARPALLDYLLTLRTTF